MKTLGRIIRTVLFYTIVVPFCWAYKKVTGKDLFTFH